MKEQKGSITLYVLLSVLFFVFILVGVYINFVNKSTSMQKQIAQIQEEYKYDDNEIDDLYNKIENSAGTKIENLLDANGNIIGEKVSDGQGGVVPVPTEFYYVGGIVKTGAVISDNVEDENEYKGQADVGTDLDGNQFVWVPVDGTTLTYAQDHTYDSKHQYKYTSYSDWTDEGENSTSVETYGGFYIGRYEAGWSEEVADGSTYGTTSTKNIDTKVPVSKAGVASWNFISQTKAKTVSANMYSSSTAVASSLVDSLAWDTTINWLKNTGIIEETSEGKINSTSYGNYYNSSSSIAVSNTIYAYHVYRTLKTGGTGSNGWDSYAKTYTKGDITLGAVSTEGSDETNYTYTKRLEIATGSTEETKTNNIYDLAGNMWEWTTEEGKHNTDTSDFAVLRGGSFDPSGYNYPVVFRHGNLTVGSKGVNLGFRVVLYIR